jgi:hypothetical protein
MGIKITGSPEDLQAIHQLLYENDKDVEVDEEYGPIQGYQKEPNVAALIVGATSTVVAIIHGYFKTRQEKYKTDKAQETELIKLYCKEQREWKKINDKELKDLVKTKDQKKLKDEKNKNK